MQQIGKYDLLERLGIGAQGVVFKARDRILDRVVALKQLKQGDDDRDLKSVLTEARTLARLSHPNIVTLFEHVEQDGSLFLAMEYVPGTPLSKRLTQGIIPIPEALAMMTAITHALATAKQHGILHRDIKPANIMVDHNGHPKLIDFGLAQLTQRDETLATLSKPGVAEDYLDGTIPYLAPERLLGQPAGEQSDIFALGAVFYEILSGQAAFKGRNMGETLHAILNHNPPPPKEVNPEIPDWLERLVLKMLHKDTALRTRRMSEVLLELNSRGQIAPASSITSRLRALLPSVARLKHGRTWLSVLAVATTLALALWASTIIIRTEAPPVSVRMANGVELVSDFARSGAIDEALSIFEGILAEDSDHAAARAGLALALCRKYTRRETDPATLQRASAAAQIAYDSDPHLALSHIAMAWTAELRGQVALAHEFYDSAAVLHPDHMLALEGRARSFRMQGRNDEAVATLQQAVKLYPDEAVFLTTYGDLLIRMGRFADAETKLERAILLSSDNPITYAQLAQAQHMQDRTLDAVRTIQAGLSIAQDAALYNNLGTYLFFLGQYDQAADAFRRTLEFDGNSHNYVYWANLGDAYRFVPGKMMAAQSAYERAIALLLPELDNRPDHPGLNSRLALYQAKAGDADAAIDRLKFVFAQETVAPVQYYRATVTYEMFEDRAVALTMLERALLAGYPMTEIMGDPELESLRQDPAFAELSLMEERHD